jgi:uncharacterized phage-associated protein
MAKRHQHKPDVFVDNIAFFVFLCVDPAKKSFDFVIQKKNYNFAIYLYKKYRIIMYEALDIANKIIKSASDNDAGELVSNLKLQKLLYYQQGFHLAYFGTPLFEDEIEAWQYGPVVPSVYERFKSNGNRGIKYNKETITLSVPHEESLFNEVNKIYGSYSAIGLMEMTHQETPWKTTKVGVGNIISKDKLKSFFKKRLK